MSPEMKNREETLSIEERIEQIIESNDTMAEILAGDPFQKLLQREKELAGSDEVQIGGIFCVDGRLPSLFSRLLNTWRSAGSYVPKVGALLGTALEHAAKEKDRFLLELVTSHYSGKTGHGCGWAKATLQQYFDPNPEEVRDFARKVAGGTLNVITQKFNEFCKADGVTPQERVGVQIEIDTDDFGLTLVAPENRGVEMQVESLNMARLAIHHKSEILALDKSRFKDKAGIYLEKFDKTESFLEFYGDIVDLTDCLLNTKNSLVKEVDAFIREYFSDLVPAQIKGLKFMLVRNIAFEFLTGLNEVEGEPTHSFVEHDERAMVFSPRGKRFGRFLTNLQLFGTTPSNTEEAISAILMEIGLLEAHEGQKPHILFLSEPVDEKVWIELGEKNELRDLVISKQAQLFIDLHQNIEIKRLVKEGKIVIVPLIVDADTAKVLERPDYTAYL
ncbi:hypothetical protein GYA49_04225 [Candidatus Beckwithbacteria bacterium]|nr:hypothetical protein [Candidatus Beckwithbacteria bacterium]